MVREQDFHIFNLDSCLLKYEDLPEAAILPTDRILSSLDNALGSQPSFIFKTSRYCFPIGISYDWSPELARTAKLWECAMLIRSS